VARRWTREVDPKNKYIVGELRMGSIMQKITNLSESLRFHVETMTIAIMFTTAKMQQIKWWAQKI
jgi:hypothetical protein